MDQNTSNKKTFNYMIPGAVLCASEESLSDKAKLIYGVLNALSLKHGFCYATNNYIQKAYGFKVRTIARCLVQLKEAGFIKIVHENNNPYKRKIYIQDIAERVEETSQHSNGASQTYATDGTQKTGSQQTTSATSGTRGMPSVTPSCANDGKRGVPNTAQDYATSGTHNISNNINKEYKGFDSSLQKEEESKPIPKDVQEVQAFMDEQAETNGFVWKCSAQEFYDYMDLGNWAIQGQKQNNWKLSLCFFNAKRSIGHNSRET